jgi:hypothetical protein
MQLGYLRTSVYCGVIGGVPQVSCYTLLTDICVFLLSHMQLGYLRTSVYHGVIGGVPVIFAAQC